MKADAGQAWRQNKQDRHRRREPVKGRQGQQGQSSGADTWHPGLRRATVTTLSSVEARTLPLNSLSPDFQLSCPVPRRSFTIVEEACIRDGEKHILSPGGKIHDEEDLSSRF